jgi:hypothetical protein
VLFYAEREGLSTGSSGRSPRGPSLSRRGAERAGEITHRVHEGDDELPAHAALVQFRRRIDPKDVLRIIESAPIA